MRNITSVVITTLLASTSALAQSMDPDSPDFDPVKRMQIFYPSWQPPKIDEAELAKHPLGSRERPLRTHGTKGTREYFSRLRCADGSLPKVQRRGSDVRGVFGYPIDIYELTCQANPPTTVVVDIYHPRFVESAAIPSFKLAE